MDKRGILDAVANIQAAVVSLQYTLPQQGLPADDAWYTRGLLRLECAGKPDVQPSGDSQYCYKPEFGTQLVGATPKTKFTKDNQRLATRLLERHPTAVVLRRNRSVKVLPWMLSSKDLLVPGVYAEESGSKQPSATTPRLSVSPPGHAEGVASAVLHGRCATTAHIHAERICSNYHEAAGLGYGKTCAKPHLTCTCVYAIERIP
jgi:hypothetical protein